MPAKWASIWSKINKKVANQNALRDSHVTITLTFVSRLRRALHSLSSPQLPSKNTRTPAVLEPPSSTLRESHQFSSMSAYYNSSHANGQQWQQPNGSWQSSSSSSSGHQQQLPHSAQHNQQQQAYAMQLLMHQMQHTFPPANGQQQSFQTSASPASTMEHRKLPTPSPQDNALLAQIIHEQTKRGLTHKAALESLHGVSSQHSGAHEGVLI